MNEKEIGRVWAENYPKLRGNRDAAQICEGICRLIREESRFEISLRRSGTLQRVLDGCGISKAQFDDVEKSSSKV
jgi:hypothetical protein